VADTNVYLATTAQAYPRVNAWNTSVGIARECVSALLSDLAVRQPGAQRVSAVA